MLKNINKTGCIKLESIQLILQHIMNKWKLSHRVF